MNIPNLQWEQKANGEFIRDMSALEAFMNRWRDKKEDVYQLFNAFHFSTTMQKESIKVAAESAWEEFLYAFPHMTSSYSWTEREDIQNLAYPQLSWAVEDLQHCQHNNIEFETVGKNESTQEKTKEILKLMSGNAKEMDRDRIHLTFIIGNKDEHAFILSIAHFRTDAEGLMVMAGHYLQALADYSSKDIQRDSTQSFKNLEPAFRQTISENLLSLYDPDNVLQRTGETFGELGQALENGLIISSDKNDDECFADKSSNVILRALDSENSSLFRTKCRQHGLTVTSVFDAALRLATLEHLSGIRSPPSDGWKSLKFISFPSLCNLRRFQSEEQKLKGFTPVSFTLMTIVLDLKGWKSEADSESSLIPFSHQLHKEYQHTLKSDPTSTAVSAHDCIFQSDIWNNSPPDETFLFHVLSSIGIIEDHIKRQFVGYQGNKIILQDYSLQCRIPKGDVRIFHLYNFDDQIRFQVCHGYLLPRELLESILDRIMVLVKTIL